jgi:hypothetical protein
VNKFRVQIFGLPANPKTTNHSIGIHVKMKRKSDEIAGVESTDSTPPKKIKGMPTIIENNRGKPTNLGKKQPYPPKKLRETFVRACLTLRFLNNILKNTQNHSPTGML